MTAADNLQPRQFGDYTLRYREQDQAWGESRHNIDAHLGDRVIGRLNWGGAEPSGKINTIQVDPTHQRHGVATAMWKYGQEMQTKPVHSNDRTREGEAWSRAVGGLRPRMSR